MTSSRLSVSDMAHLRRTHEAQLRRDLQAEYEELLLAREMELLDARRTIMGYRLKENDLRADLQFTQDSAETVLEALDKRCKEEQQKLKEEQQRLKETETQLKLATDRIKMLEERLSQYTGEEGEEYGLDMGTEAYAAGTDVVPVETYGRTDEYSLSPRSARSQKTYLAPYPETPTGSSTPARSPRSPRQPYSPHSPPRTARGTVRPTVVRPPPPPNRGATPGFSPSSARAPSLKLSPQQQQDLQQQQQQTSPYAYRRGGTSFLGGREGEGEGEEGYYPMVGAPPTPHSPPSPAPLSKDKNRAGEPQRGLWGKLTGKAAQEMEPTVVEPATAPAGAIGGPSVSASMDSFERYRPERIAAAATGRRSSVGEDDFFDARSVLSRGSSTASDDVLEDKEHQAEVARKVKEEADAARKEREQAEMARKWKEETDSKRKRREDAELARQKREEAETESKSAATTSSGKPIWPWPPPQPPVSPRSADTEAVIAPGAPKVAALVASLQAN